MQREGRKFGVSRWAAWPPAGGNTREKPDLRFVPPLLRRRLSGLSASALSVANQCLDGRHGVPVVFASQHGELARTAEILADMAEGIPMSPTAFSLSVHNSAIGLHALAHKDHAAGTALAAGGESLLAGLLESIVQALDNGSEVLLVFADASPPALFKDVVPGTGTAFALALLINSVGRDYSLHGPDGAFAETPAGDAVSQAMAMASLLTGDATSVALGEAGNPWRLDSHARTA